ncbi:MFS transporter [Trichophyton verrucosum HKI 0517]|uniref:MFS transporter n=1 Tax=Trichophyton verrucosum (strain HKI 0517) TaxID=663202 RepID=D4DJA1_TRIVH|nr:MFS transporter [Trichophyton verrucosum HKI 0517]EFE38077.1 MFS transporter [Trichophyton verrucosum HKI 0517]
MLDAGCWTLDVGCWILLKPDAYTPEADEGATSRDDSRAMEASKTEEELVGGLQQLSDEELQLEKKLRRKIDSLIMPLVILVYLLNYIDRYVYSASLLVNYICDANGGRNNYAAARLQGLEADLGLEGSQYQTGLSVLFVAYILMQVPSNLLLNYMGRPSLYLGGFTVAWGAVSALTSLVHTYQQIVVCRFLLGLVEAPFFAGVLFYLSKWYTKRELSLRMSIFYSGSLISGAFGSLIAAGILNGLAGARGLSAWRWLYIIEGVITIAVGLVIVVVLPDFPDTWKLLPADLKHVANKRLAVEAAEADVDVPGGMSQLRGLRLAMTDVKTYAIAIAYMSITAASGFQNFFPTLTQTLGYSKIISLLLVAPPYLFMVVYSLAHSWYSDRRNNRFWFFIYPIPITLVGFIIFMTTDAFGPRYFSFFLMIFVFALNGTLYGWIASAIPRPPAKRAAAYAFINSLGNSASIWTPFTYRNGDQPHYRLALGVAVACQLLAAACVVFLRWYLQRQNRELARYESVGLEQLTDKELAKLQRTAEIENVDVHQARLLQLGFRYQL